MLYERTRVFETILKILKTKFMSCSKCGENRELVNKHFKLCLICNNERLNSNKMNRPVINRFTHTQKTVNKTKDKIDEDEKFYLECFNLSNHECEECGKQLPTEFKDENGKIIARWRYSHILPKSTHPKLRHKVENINHLCLIHHTQWDHGDKTNMKIYGLNSKKFPNHF